jgi:DNA-directed RNA polymerase subunit RPC12/RpoP
MQFEGATELELKVYQAITLNEERDGGEDQTNITLALSNAVNELQRLRGVILTMNLSSIALNENIRQDRETICELRSWIDDLQSGMYVNCVYCGHRYGPKDQVPSTMASVLKQHIEQCPKHPMSELKKQNKELADSLAGLRGVERSK